MTKCEAPHANKPRLWQTYKPNRTTLSKLSGKVYKLTTSTNDKLALEIVADLKSFAFPWFDVRSIS